MEGRLTKHLVFKALKTALTESKALENKTETRTSYWKKRHVVTAWKQFIQLRSKAEIFKNKLAKRQAKDTFNALRASLKDSQIKTLTVKSAELEKQVKDRV